MLNMFLLTTMKYSTQSAEQTVSNTNAIRPSSDPVAPAMEVGGLFNTEEMAQLQGPSKGPCQSETPKRRRKPVSHTKVLLSILPHLAGSVNARNRLSFSK